MTYTMFYTDASYTSRTVQGRAPLDILTLWFSPPFILHIAHDNIPAARSIS